MKTPQERASFMNSTGGGRSIGRPLSFGDGSGACAVEQLQQLVGGELDLLVAPLRGSVVARDQAHAVDATEISVDERVPRLGFVRGPLGEPEVPVRVLLPGMRLQERVLVVGARLDIPPVAVQHVLPGFDELPSACDGAL